MTPAEFIYALAPAARASAAKTGIPASFVIAEGALESAWGASMLAAQAMNLFGVKADTSWRGAVLTMPTREFLRGQWVVVQARWRKYTDWQGCIDDHAQFLLTNPRYKAALACKDGRAFARAVAVAGYATDPKYADKIIAVIDGRGLAAYDKP